LQTVCNPEHVHASPRFTPRIAQPVERPRLAGDADPYPTLNADGNCFRCGDGTAGRAAAGRPVKVTRLFPTLVGHPAVKIAGDAIDANDSERRWRMFRRVARLVSAGCASSNGEGDPDGTFRSNGCASRLSAGAGLAPLRGSRARWAVPPRDSDGLRSSLLDASNQAALERRTVRMRHPSTDPRPLRRRLVPSFTGTAPTAHPQRRGRRDGCQAGPRGLGNDRVLRLRFKPVGKYLLRGEIDVSEASLSHSSYTAPRRVKGVEKCDERALARRAPSDQRLSHNAGTETPLQMVPERHLGDARPRTEARVPRASSLRSNRVVDTNRGRVEEAGP